MAFTVTARQSVSTGTVGSQTATTNSTTPTASSLFIACWGSENNSDSTAPSLQTPTGGSLTYTLIAKNGESPTLPWSGSATFNAAHGVYRADVGGSPASFAVTFDSFVGTNTAFYEGSCFDITGHSSSTPVQSKANGATVNPSSNTATGTVTFDAAVTSGNLIAVSIYSTSDAGGAVTSPTIGSGKTFTTISAGSSAAFSTIGTFYRVADGTESTTITCSDLGQSVGSYSMIAFEIAAAGGAPPPAPTLRVVRSNIRFT